MEVKVARIMKEFDRSFEQNSYSFLKHLWQITRCISQEIAVFPFFFPRVSDVSGSVSKLPD